MATKTRAQLVTEAAFCLGIIGTGQALDDDDEDAIDVKVEPLIDQLASDSIVDIDNIAEIPNEYFNALAELLANACASKFGQPYSEEKKRVFEGQLKKTAASTPTYPVLRGEYF